MSLTRRGFLGALATVAAGMTLDPERLLWVPGQKTLFLAPASGWMDEQCLREMIQAFGNNLHTQITMHREYYECWDTAITGETVRVRLPRRFLVEHSGEPWPKRKES